MPASVFPEQEHRPEMGLLMAVCSVAQVGKRAFPALVERKRRIVDVVDHDSDSDGFSFPQFGGEKIVCGEEYPVTVSVLRAGEGAGNFRGDGVVLRRVDAESELLVRRAGAPDDRGGAGGVRIDRVVVIVVVISADFAGTGVGERIEIDLEGVVVPAICRIGELPVDEDGIRHRDFHEDSLPVPRGPADCAERGIRFSAIVGCQRNRRNPVPVDRVQIRMFRCGAHPDGAEGEIVGVARSVLRRNGRPDRFRNDFPFGQRFRQRQFQIRRSASGNFYFLLTERSAEGGGEEIFHGDLHAVRGNGIRGDLKPDNILVSTAGDIKLADLGLAKSMYEESVKRDVMVTPLYAAPEIISGKVTSANLASDIYSFGATLYHVTVGEPPFKSEKIEEIYRRHLSEQPVPPAERNREIPESLSAVILAMLEKDPAKRPASWEEISAMLNEAREFYQLSHSAVDARPPLSRTLVAAGSAFVLLLFAGGVFTVLHFTKKSPPSPPPVVQEKKTSSSGVPVLIPPREDSTKLDARLRTEWADLKKRSAMLSPERKIREFRTFMERNNLQESLLQEVQREMAHARLEIRRRRRAAAAYAEEIAVFLSLTRFAPFLDRDSIRNLNRLAAGIERKGKLPHLRRVHAGRSKELAVSAAILKMRQNGLDALNGLPYPLKAEEKKTPQKSSSARAEQRRGDKSSGKSAGKKSAPSSVKRKSPAAVAEKEFIDIIARQVRNFEPDVLRMQLTGFA